ncbi:Uma2 family endonuclease [Streptomyces sp. SAI-041]|uniref:Uma2 family endonuclease n=1 Tax=Streptomyces sp. SAI-041 TaxID=2940548 RepID=UPI0024768840|nr:Uma2 family endonuclease [Streptomyces sp. SAI-041]MDH6549804.1 Uma2 family endonuclease [Streptomyces sp. SAI-041]
MTVMAERAVQSSQMSVEEFERIAAFAAKETDDAVRFEFINGRIGVKKVADGDHNNSDTDQRDRQEKPVAYGAAGIPLYMLIDRDACTVTLYGDPDAGVGYRSSRKEPFGARLLLPEPLGIELDTEKLKQYVD